MDIAEVARRSGVPASALRYYEEKGLIASTGRRGLRRLFDADVLEQAGLVSTEKVGRVRTCRLGRRRLEEEAAWIDAFRQLYRVKFPIESMGIAELQDLDAPPTGDGNVTQVMHVDEAARVIYFQGVDKRAGGDPYFRNLYKIGFDGKDQRHARYVLHMKSTRIAILRATIALLAFADCWIPTASSAVVSSDAVTLTKVTGSAAVTP